MNFVPEMTILFQFALASFVLAITPGPDMALFVGRAITHGRAAALACLLGAVTGIVVHTALVALGLSALLVAAPSAFLALKIVGAAYLVWLAYQAIRYGSSFSPAKEKAKVNVSLWKHYLTGIGINILNPKIAMFFLTFLPQFVSANDPDAPGKLLFLGLFFIVVAVPTTLPMVFAANWFANGLKKAPKVTRGLDYIFAAVFGAFAVKILTTQVAR